MYVYEVADVCEVAFVCEVRSVCRVSNASLLSNADMIRDAPIFLMPLKSTYVLSTNEKTNQSQNLALSTCLSSKTRNSKDLSHGCL